MLCFNIVFPFYRPLFLVQKSSECKPHFKGEADYRPKLGLHLRCFCSGAAALAPDLDSATPPAGSFLSSSFIAIADHIVVIRHSDVTLNIFVLLWALVLPTAKNK